MSLQTYIPHSGSYRNRVKSTSTGYTDLQPSADSRVVYVSSSTGNDSNDGLSPSSPKATILGGRSLLRDGYADWICFKCGDTFANVLSDANWEIGGVGRSVAAPQVWTSYGTGARPIFTPIDNSKNGLNFNWSASYIAVVGLHVKAANGGGGSGLWMYVWQNNVVTNFLFEDCVFEGFKDNIVIQGQPTNLIQNVTIRRCNIIDAASITDAHSQGAYINYVDGLTIEECIIDHNGWANSNRSDATIYNHNLYLGTGCTGNTVVRNNIISRASSHGLQLRGGGIATGNLFLLNPISCQLGGGDPDPHTHTYGITGQVTNNVILNGCDINASLVRGWGIICLNVGMDGATISNNLVANVTSASTDGQNSNPIYLWSDNYGCGVGNNYVKISNNTFYGCRCGVKINPAPASPPLYASFTSTVGNVFENNDVQVNNAVSNPSVSATTPIYGRDFVSTPATIASLFIFRNNRYYWNDPSGYNIINYWNGKGRTFSGSNVPDNNWVTETGDTNSVVSASTYVDSTRSVGSYYASIGGTSSATDFLTAIRSQRKGSWELDYTSTNVNAYIKAGFVRI